MINPAAAAPPALIRVSELTKTFRIGKVKEGMLGAVAGLFHREYTDKVAVDRISFSIGEGEMVGYIGTNGAGKSTTIKMLTGILVPTSGEIEVAGFTPWKNRRQYVSQIGVVFGQRTQMWWDLAVVESFRLLARIYELPPALYQQRIGELTEMLELSEFMHTPVRKLSLGQRMRCDLAAALLHRPRLLFLDEPTIGLDIVARARVREFLRGLKQNERTTVILTTHDLDEIEELCSRIIIIDHGRMVFDGDRQTLIDRSHARKKLLVEFQSAPNDALFEALRERDITVSSPDELHREFAFDPKAHTAADVIEQVLRSGGVRDLKIEEPGIEGIVAELYQQRGIELTA